MLLDELCYHINTNSTARTLGTNLFKGPMSPNAPDTATFIQEYGGESPELRMGSSTPFYELPRVQIIDRSTDYQKARNKAETWYKLFMGLANTTVKPSSGATGTRYLAITPLQSPFSIGQDANERYQIVCNYECTKYLST